MTFAQLHFFLDAPRLIYFGFTSAVFLLFAACGSGSDVPPASTANSDNQDRPSTQRVTLGTGWQLHKEAPDPFTDSVFHSLSNEVANMQKDAPTLRFYLRCREGKDFQDFQLGDVGVRFSSKIYDLERGSGAIPWYQTPVGVRWDQNEAEHVSFWRRTLGWPARGGLYTSAGPAHPDPLPDGRSRRPETKETANEAMRMFIDKMTAHRTLLLRFYHDDYPHLDYRFNLQNFAERMAEVRERCRGPADTD